jgi:predicted RNA-binding protein YlqC (UPF0109 family)
LRFAYKQHGEISTWFDRRLEKMDGQTDSSTAIGGGEQAIEDMLLYIARSLADHPEEVKVQYVSDEEGAAFQIQAHEDDLGQLIGKKGQTARALESIVNSNRRRSGCHYHLDIVGTAEIA